jgi:SAM-dependent methyltransferase
MTTRDDAMAAIHSGRRLAGRAFRATAERLAPSSPLLSEPGAVEVSPPIVLPTSVPCPLPEGWSEDEIRSVMTSFCIDDMEAGALTPYVDDALWRFLHSWGLVRAEEGRALELGGNPYFITWLLDQFSDLDVSVANYFGGPSGTAHQEVRYTSRGTDHLWPIEYEQFNLEEEVFPYADGTFRVVLFCEIIEHLLMNPLHALREIHRVLEPGGLLVLTTPNVARLGNVLALLSGANIYDPYSGYGPYGRHNREFTRHELHLLLGFAGFGELHSFTADAHPSDFTGQVGYDAVAPSLVHRAPDLGQYVFVAARKTGTPRGGLPTFFYRSWPEERLVEL